jgi:hypothetical protein
LQDPEQDSARFLAEHDGISYSLAVPAVAAENLLVR